MLWCVSSCLEVISIWHRVLWQTQVFITSSLSRVYNTVSNWFQTSMTCCRCLKFLVFETQFEISCPGPAVDIIYLPDIIIIHLFIYWLSWGRNDWKRMAARSWAVSWWISRSQRALAFNYQNPLVPLLVDLFSDGPTLNLTQRTLTISKVKPKASKKKTNRIRRFFRFRYSVVCQVI